MTRNNHYVRGRGVRDSGEIRKKDDKEEIEIEDDNSDDSIKDN